MDQRNLGENPHSRGGYKGGKGGSKGGTMPRVEEESSSSVPTHTPTPSPTKTYERHEDFELDIVWCALQHLSTDSALSKERMGMFLLDDIEKKIYENMITTKNPPEHNKILESEKQTFCKNSIGGIILQGPEYFITGKHGFCNKNASDPPSVQKNATLNENEEGRQSAYCVRIEEALKSKENVTIAPPSGFDKAPVESKNDDAIGPNDRCPDFSEIPDKLEDVCNEKSLSTDLTKAELDEANKWYKQYYANAKDWVVSNIPYEADKMSEYRRPFSRSMEALIALYYIDVGKRHNAQKEEWQQKWYDARGLSYKITESASHRHSDIRQNTVCPVAARETTIKTSETTFSRDHNVVCQEASYADEFYPGYQPWDGVTQPMPVWFPDQKTGEILGKKVWDVRIVCNNLREHLTTLLFRKLTHAASFFQQFRDSVAERRNYIDAISFWNEHIRDRTCRAQFQYVGNKGDWYIGGMYPPMPINGEVEHDPEAITGFQHIEAWKLHTSRTTANNMRINSDCVRWIKENCKIARTYDCIPQGTYLYVALEYMPVPTARFCEFFVSNVALYVRSTGILKWFKNDLSERIDVPSWNQHGTINKVQIAMNKWQVPERQRLNLDEDAYNAEDNAVLERWANLLRADGVNPDDPN